MKRMGVSFLSVHEEDRCPLSASTSKRWVSPRCQCLKRKGQVSSLCQCTKSTGVLSLSVHEKDGEPGSATEAATKEVRPKVAPGVCPPPPGNLAEFGPPPCSPVCGMSTTREDRTLRLVARRRASLSNWGVLGGGCCGMMGLSDRMLPALDSRLSLPLLG